jgi:cystathionine beta-lyase/cystathionine gamma-synthase
MAKTGSNSGFLHESTLAVHGGEFVDPATRASSPNLVMSATFAPTDVTGFSARDEKDYDGFVYGRVSSPTVRQLEHKLAALEGAESALAFGSGVAASHAVIAGRLGKGDHLLMPESNYVGVAELTRDTLPRFGIETSFVDTLDAKAVAACGWNRPPIPPCKSVISKPWQHSPMKRVCATWWLIQPMRPQSPQSH